MSKSGEFELSQFQEKKSFQFHGYSNSTICYLFLLPADLASSPRPALSIFAGVMPETSCNPLLLRTAAISLFRVFGLRDILFPVKYFDLYLRDVPSGNENDLSISSAP